MLINMKQSEIQLCPQCRHPLHLPLGKEEPDLRSQYKGSFNTTGGCNQVVWVKINSLTGLQETHEHCDCDFNDGSILEMQEKDEHEAFLAGEKDRTEEEERARAEYDSFRDID